MVLTSDTVFPSHAQKLKRNLVYLWVIEKYLLLGSGGVRSKRDAKTRLGRVSVFVT